MDYVELTDYLLGAEDISQLETRLRDASLQDLPGISARELAKVAAEAIETLFASATPRGHGSPKSVRTPEAIQKGLR